MNKKEMILEQVIQIVMTAGKEVLNIYNSSTQQNITTKADKSPQIEADLISHHILIDELKRLNAGFPVISEESGEIKFSERQSWNSFWLIDPLDGTKEFINRTGEFTINVALIENHKPVLGVVFMPVNNVCYYGAHKIGAYKKNQHDKEILIPGQERSSKNIIIVTSHHEKNPLPPQLLEAIGPYTLTQIGSSLKICLIAEGKADLYPRLFPTYEWDTAAAHAILLETHGDIYDLNHKLPLQYNTKPSLLNPNFVALNNANKHLLSYFV